LIEKIVAFRKREDARNGIDADDHARKRKETAQAAIDQHKRITAGLHFAAGNCRLGPELWYHAKEVMKIQQLAQDEKEKRANIRFQKMVDKVDAVRATGKLIESYNVTELRTLVIWYKREGDAPVPNTRQQLLQRYIDTCHRREQIPRNALAAAQLPDPRHAAEDAGDAVANWIAMI